MNTKITITQAYELMFRAYPDVVGIKDLSSMLGICPRKVYELLHEGNIEAIPCCKRFKVAKLSVIAYLLSCNEAA